MSDSIPLKWCSHCQKLLPATTEYFHADRSKKDGLDYTCKQCVCHSRRKKPEKPFDTSKIKQCPHCQKLLPATLQYFHSHKKYADGLYYLCKPCRRIVDEEWHMQPPIPDGYKKCYICKQILPATSEYFYEDKRNKESGLRSGCKSCIADQDHIKREQAPPFQYGGVKTCSQCKQIKSATPEYFHVDKGARDGLEPYCKSCFSLYHRQYLRAHPDAAKASRDRRRAHLKGNGGEYTSEQIQDQLKRQHYRCYYAACGFAKLKRVKINGKWKYDYHIEHTFPLSRVTGIPANGIDYLVLACPTCNRRKGKKFPWEFFEGGRLL